MMNAGDTGFMLICTAFVFFMTPGLAFFYGGLVRRKNVVNTMMACGAIMGLSVVMWTLFGYSLAFGGNHGGIIGDLRWFALNGVGWEPGPYADTIPHLVFVAFQMMFAMITPALITGAVVGRMRFKALFFFVAIWSFNRHYRSCGDWRCDNRKPQKSAYSCGYGFSNTNGKSACHFDCTLEISAVPR